MNETKRNETPGCKPLRRHGQNVPDIFPYASCNTNQLVRDHLNLEQGLSKKVLWFKGGDWWVRDVGKGPRAPTWYQLQSEECIGEVQSE